jgi:GT2 family glycosyltransferase
MSSPRASIFIPTGNRANSLEKVLKSLAQQTFTHFEVIVVDYKSTDHTAKIIESFKNKLNIKVIHQTEKGLSKAANMALAKAKGGIFTRTDDDVKMSKGWMEAIVDTFKDKKVGGVTGPTIIPDEYRLNRDLFAYEQKFKEGSFLWRMFGRIYYDWFMESKPYDVSQWFGSGAFSLGSNFETSKKFPLHEITNLEACNFTVRTDLLRKVGGFDVIYGGVGEYHEADAAWKIKKLGYKLMFNPKAWLQHLPSQDGFFSDRPSSYSRMVNFVVFYLRHIQLDSLKKLLQFSSYILFLWSYYCMAGIQTRQMKQFGAIPGTFAGFFVYLKHKSI